MINSSRPFSLFQSSDDIGTDYRVLQYSLCSVVTLVNPPDAKLSFPLLSAESTAASIGDVCGVFAICISTTFKAVP